MKKQILTLSVILCISHSSNAQNGNANPNAQWRINGNNALTTDFMGTTNNQSLVFKTNNIVRATFDTQGKTIFDGGGEMIINSSGLNRPVLSNPISAYMLKVGGSGHFDGELNSRQLFVQEYITYMKSLKGPRIDVDTIRMDSTRGIFGHTKIFGDVQIKQNLEVLGNATFKNNLTAEKGILFDNVHGVSYSVINGVKTFHFGDGTGSKPATVACAAAPYGGVLNQFGGWLQIYDPANPTTSGLLNFQTWAGGSSIDASTGGQSPSGIGTNDRLLLNYFCGNNTYINTGEHGGEVHLGKTFIGGGQRSGPYTNALLNVNGIIAAREIIVTAQNWADYVFASDYNLPNLQDVEKYYLINKHLPEIPSEKEVLDNGINVAEMNKLLLKKIEELTIYLVQQQKAIDALNAKVK